jgi:PD-(D/E)XK nuclease superfamily
MPARRSAGAVPAAATKLSRSKLELFTECQRCFWLDVKKGVKRPQGPPFTLNNAVDYLLKEEFDRHRAAASRHPVMEKFKIDAVPFQHAELNKWRHNFTGVQVHHAASGLMIYGAVDDVWVNPKGELIVVDYKATGAKEHKIYDSYGRQMEIYQWLLQQNGFSVSPVGYFVFARVNKADGFGNGDAALAFDLFVEPYAGDNTWVEHTVMNARKALDKEDIPESGANCPYCSYRVEAAHYD